MDTDLYTSHIYQPPPDFSPTLVPFSPSSSHPSIPQSQVDKHQHSPGRDDWPTLLPDFSLVDETPDAKTLMSTDNNLLDRLSFAAASRPSHDIIVTNVTTDSCGDGVTSQFLHELVKTNAEDALSMTGTHADLMIRPCAYDLSRYFVSLGDVERGECQWLGSLLPAFLEDEMPSVGSLQKISPHLIVNGKVDTNVDDMSRVYVNIQDVNSYVAESDSAKLAESTFQPNIPSWESINQNGGNDDDDPPSSPLIKDVIQNYDDHPPPVPFPSPVSDTNATSVRLRNSNNTFEDPPTSQRESDHHRQTLPLDTEMEKDENSHMDDLDDYDKLQEASLQVPKRRSLRRRVTTSSRKKGRPVYPFPSPLSSSSEDDVIDNQSSSPSPSSHETHTRYFHPSPSSEDDDPYLPSPRAPRKCYIFSNEIVAGRKTHNVERACNHCKRSHVRCDEQRPCHRCVAAGKDDCCDVEQKPRGRPRNTKNKKRREESEKRV
ncbi:hypothetical protein BC936DRAFT_147839 [Jimgerdemannia flammicorona]|uniref:Zn(2)-C6 fungal-type domain-containing protein n=1 Tax=Jimgerdemannia flammicorona TaxID=994334 RepID=A0A433D4D4_9FUNG|nr:hypothetical protein BC936DRAFT_147839 [Jimgerdemannia flammicorona]